MTTPKRWIDEGSGADDFERAVLRAELDAAPPVRAEGDVLKRVMAMVAPFGPGGPGPAAPAAPATGGVLGGAAIAKSATTLATLGKGFALGIGVSVAAATANHYLIDGASRGTASPSTSVLLEASATSRVAAPAEVSPRVIAPEEDTASPLASPALESPPPRANRATGVPVAEDQISSERAPGAPSVASFPAPEAELAASRLKEEAALLRRARAELRSGALAAAFATLEASRQRFTAPELSQEREALAIELLYRSGERAAAASRARDFLARFPESPHAASVRAFANEAPR